MGGKPVLAIAILGWPVNILPAAVAQKVIEGGRSICAEAGIPLAGGHSIDTPEPIFGLAVNGLVPLSHIKKNNEAKEGNLLLLTKPLGVGILTTAEKKGILKEEHQGVAAQQMMQLNKVGAALGSIAGVTAMTDVTGFGLLGHLLEMAEGSGLGAFLDFDNIPVITPWLGDYIKAQSIPGGTQRNMDSYGGKIGTLSEYQRAILADPQTSGGLLVAVDPGSLEEVTRLFNEHGLAAFTTPIGKMIAKEEKIIRVA
jgi:selenide,water dikinase